MLIVFSRFENGFSVLVAGVVDPRAYRRIERKES